MAYQVKNKEGEVITREGKELMASDSVGVVKGIDLENRTLRIIATDETVDRDGDIISMKGWQLDNYIKNPVFLWSHDYSSVPIGAAIKIEKKRSPSRLVLTHKFPTAGVHPFADMILQLYHEKVVNAGSVGFIPYDWEEIKEEDEEKFFGPKKFISQELLEHSGCAVPANPNALQDSIGSAMKSLKIGYDDKTKLYRVVTGEDILQLGEEEKEKVTSEIGEIIDRGPTVEEETAVQVQVPEDVVKDEGKIEEINLNDYILKSDIDINFIEDFLKSGAIPLDEPFISIKNLIEEILERHIAESLAEEKGVYLKRADVLLKIGAVLSAKNKGLLQTASDNILKVLESAEPPQEEVTEPERAVDQASLEEANDDDQATVFDVILDDEGKATKAVENVVKIQPLKPSRKKATRRKAINQINSAVSDLQKLLGTL